MPFPGQENTMTHAQIPPTRLQAEDSWFTLVMVLVLMIASIFGGGFVLADQAAKLIGSLQVSGTNAPYAAVE